MNKKIFVFDTTLRDGEQVPGCQLNTKEKIEVACCLEELGVDILEAGFPISSPGDLHSVQEITKVVKKPVITALGRAIKEDIDAVWESLRYAKRKRIHTFISSSDVHIIHQFKSTREKVLQQAVDSVKYAKTLCEDVEFSAMDAGRTDNDFLAAFIESVIKAGATTVNIPDTTGYCLPEEFGEKITYLFNHVKGIENVVVSVHCHNDLGMATANTIAAIAHGARQMEVTVNGVGERAGNTALEEVAMILRTRKDIACDTQINAAKIYPVSRLVSRLMHMPVQPNKAIVGRNAFAHSSGIHQNGILKNRFTYEIINPADIGIKESSLTLTARSGRSALKYHLGRLGFNLTQERLDEVYKKFIMYADQKKNITDDDLYILMDEKMPDKHDEVKSIILLQESNGTARAKVTIMKNGLEKTGEATGADPIDAAINAVSCITGKKVRMEEYQILAAADQPNSARVHMYLRHGKDSYYGFSENSDILKAAVNAYINGLNKYRQ
jgi:2-isopropylmalate synthase